MKRSDNIKRLRALGKELSAKPKVSGSGNKTVKAEKPKVELNEEPRLEEGEIERLIESIEKED